MSNSGPEVSWTCPEPSGFDANRSPLASKAIRPGFARPNGGAGLRDEPITASTVASAISSRTTVTTATTLGLRLARFTNRRGRHRSATSRRGRCRVDSTPASAASSSPSGARPTACSSK